MRVCAVILCYVCARLKQESRIAAAREAEVVVNGISLCMHHSFFAIAASGATPALMAAESARADLVKWWERAEQVHGEWSIKRGAFKDGTGLVDFYWESAP